MLLLHIIRRYSKNDLILIQLHNTKIKIIGILRDTDIECYI